MAILAIFTGVGISKAMYESLRKEIGWESKRQRLCPAQYRYLP